MDVNMRKIAVIWCRVSTSGQMELSLDSRELAVRQVLEALEVPITGAVRPQSGLVEFGPDVLSGISTTPPLDRVRSY